MASRLEMYNMALSAARSPGGTLQSLVQRTRGREELDKWWDLVLDVTQEAAYWPCCRVRAELSPPVELTDQEYLYQYPLPSDLLRPWYLSNFQPFSLGSDGSANVLYTNVPDAVLYYAQRVTDPSRFTAAMTQAIVYGLAYKISESLTGLDSLVERLLLLANGYLQQAQADSLMFSGEHEFTEYDPSWIRARYSDLFHTNPPIRAPFVYLFGGVWTRAY